jgi:hypothetical protein
MVTQFTKKSNGLLTPLTEKIKFTFFTKCVTNIFLLTDCKLSMTIFVGYTI